MLALPLPPRAIPLMVGQAGQGSSLHPARARLLQHAQDGVRAAVGACGYLCGEQAADLLSGVAGAQCLPVSQQPPAWTRTGGRPVPIPRSTSHPGGARGGRPRAAAASASSAALSARSARPSSPRRHVTSVRSRGRSGGRTDTAQPPYCARRASLHAAHKGDAPTP